MKDSMISMEYSPHFNGQTNPLVIPSIRGVHCVMAKPLGAVQDTFFHAGDAAVPDVPVANRKPRVQLGSSWCFSFGSWIMPIESHSSCYTQAMFGWFHLQLVCYDEYDIDTYMKISRSIPECSKCRVMNHTNPNIGGFVSRRVEAAGIIDL